MAHKYNTSLEVLRRAEKCSAEQQYAYKRSIVLVGHSSLKSMWEYILLHLGVIILCNYV